MGGMSCLKEPLKTAPKTPLPQVLDMRKVNIQIAQMEIVKYTRYPNDDRNAQWEVQEVFGTWEEEVQKAFDEKNGRGGAYLSIILCINYYDEQGKYVASYKKNF
jgi:hypothetical protein